MFCYKNTLENDFYENALKSVLLKEYIEKRFCKKNLLERVLQQNYKEFYYTWWNDKIVALEKTDSISV